MSGSYLLDTNAAIAFVEGDAALKQLLDVENPILYLSLAVMGELYFGMEKSSRQDSNRRRLESLLTRCQLLESDLRTAEVYGKIRFALQSKGRPIPNNDIWISAVAMQYGLAVLTRDKHFREVDDLEAVGW